MKKIRKIQIWHNPTKVCERWDAEIWYTNGTQERLTDTSKEEIIQYINQTEMQLEASE